MAAEQPPGRSSSCSPSSRVRAATGQRGRAGAGQRAEVAEHEGPVQRGPGSVNGGRQVISSRPRWAGRPSWPAGRPGPGRERSTGRIPRRRLSSKSSRTTRTGTWPRTCSRSRASRWAHGRSIRSAASTASAGHRRGPRATGWRRRAAARPARNPSAETSPLRVDGHAPGFEAADPRRDLGGQRGLADSADAVQDQPGMSPSRPGRRPSAAALRTGSRQGWGGAGSLRPPWRAERGAADEPVPRVLLPSPRVARLLSAPSPIILIYLVAHEQSLPP